MAETTPLLRVQLLTGARGFKSLSVRHYFKKRTENPVSYGNKKKLPAVFFADIFSDYPIKTVKFYTSKSAKMIYNTRIISTDQ